MIVNLPSLWRKIKELSIIVAVFTWDMLARYRLFIRLCRDFDSTTFCPTLLTQLNYQTRTPMADFRDGKESYIWDQRNLGRYSVFCYNQELVIVLCRVVVCHVQGIKRSIHFVFVWFFYFAVWLFLHTAVLVFSWEIE